MRDPAYENLKDSGKLPSPSGVALELLRLVDDQATSIDKIAATVEADPAIASRLLKLVNSPLSGTSRTIASISMAVRLLGTKAVKNLALGLSLLSANRSGESKAFEFERFWSESLARGVAARNMAKHFDCCAPDEAFSVALLSRIGRLALATAFPQAYDAVLERVGTGSLSELAEEERNAFDIDHCELSALMMADWRLAEVFCESVRQQDGIDPLASDEDSRVFKIARLLHLAESVAPVLSGSKVFREDLTDLVKTAEGFGFEAGAFADRFDTLKNEWSDVAAIFCVHAQASPSLRETHNRASRHDGSILVVDDDPSGLRLVTKYLADAGYEVRTASNGNEALRLIHSEGCQLIITDWRMPEMDGLELCRAIRSSEGVGFAFVIVLTAQTDVESLSQAFEAGADDFLTKPFNRQELLSRLKAGVRAQAAEAKLALQQRSIQKTNAELATLNDRLREMATTDELTGLLNRREAMHRLEEHWAAAQRDGRPLAAILLDIDHFKKCNDTQGHDAGDAVLRETAKVVRHNTRAGETPFRIGGEEFVVLCPGANAKTAAAGAERIRAAVEANRLTRNGATLSVTISAGVAERTAGSEHSESLLKLADDALYQAKRTGRNRVCIAGCDDPIFSKGSPQKSEDASPLPAAGGGSGEETPRTVLVVDPDPAGLRLFRELLERDGYTVYEAFDGPDALAKASAIRPEIIVMNIAMPNVNGIDCTRKLKADPDLNSISVIVVGEHDDGRPVRAGLEAGAQEYITKPIQPDEFLLRIRAMTRLRRSQARLVQSNSVRGEQARAMNILFDLARSLAAAGSLDAIVSHATAATVELVSSRRVSIMLPDDTGRELIVASAIGIEEHLASKIRVPVGRAIAGQVFATGRPIVLNSQSDVGDHNARYDSEFFVSVPLASRALSVPNKIVGVLNVTERHDRRPFEMHEIEYLDLVCNMAASSLEQFYSGRSREHAYAAIVIGLANLAEHRDSDTGKHLERVTQYAMLLARELRKSSQYASTIDDHFLEYLERAMPLHDIGKVSVPDSILLKPGPLSDSEFAIMKRHAAVGADSIQSVIEQAPEAGFLSMARDIAHAHHEWFNGTGYPRGLRGGAIPLAARIAAVADVYDALRTKRPYKEALPHEESVVILRDLSGSQFDPDVVDGFMRREPDFAEIAAKLDDLNLERVVVRGNQPLAACSMDGAAWI